MVNWHRLCVCCDVLSFYLLSLVSVVLKGWGATTVPCFMFWCHMVCHNCQTLIPTWKQLEIMSHQVRSAVSKKFYLWYGNLHKFICGQYIFTYKLLVFYPSPLFKNAKPSLGSKVIKTGKPESLIPKLQKAHLTYAGLVTHVRNPSMLEPKGISRLRHKSGKEQFQAFLCYKVKVCLNGKKIKKFSPRVTIVSIVQLVLINE